MLGGINCRVLCFSYRYDTVGEEHVIMYRTVEFEDVLEFSFNDKTGKPVGIQKSEVVEYKKGVLQSSRGTAHVVINKPSQASKFYHQSTDDDKTVTYDESFGTDELSGSGKYSLKLQKCAKKTLVARRSVSNEELTDGKITAH